MPTKDGDLAPVGKQRSRSFDKQENKCFDANLDADLRQAGFFIELAVCGKSTRLRYFRPVSYRVDLK